MPQITHISTIVEDRPTPDGANILPLHETFWECKNRRIAETTPIQTRKKQSLTGKEFTYTLVIALPSLPVSFCAIHFSSQYWVSAASIFNVCPWVPKQKISGGSNKHIESNLPCYKGCTETHLSKREKTFEKRFGKRGAQAKWAKKNYIGN